MYRLYCDTCEFTHETDSRADAYGTAKSHESTYPAHFVMIEGG